MFFRLPKDIYAGKWGSSIVILDARNDKYLSIADEAATAFQAALSTEFTKEGDLYTPAQQVPEDIDAELFANIIAHFIECGFIEPTQKSSLIEIKEPLKQGGLADYAWDYKRSLAPFSKVAKHDLLKALITLYKVHYSIWRSGIKGIFDAINYEKKKRKDFKMPSHKELKELSDCIDLACAFYIKKVYCLGWAAAFVLEALKRGWKCSIVIGVQGIPFYAHAWAECDGTIINDETIVQEYLSVLLKEPFG